jgi:Ser/Thr protein kinase RdoA (MazF antagonist)
MSAFGYLIEDQLIHRSETNRGYMDAMWRAKMRDFRAHEENRALADFIDYKWRSRVDLLDGCRTPKLWHNDLGPGSPLALPENGAWRISGLFDFENAFAGDPLMDIAKCVHFAKLGDAVRWKGILEGYGPVAGPNWRETVAFYTLYIAVEYWVWLSYLGRPQNELTAPLADIRRIAEAS